MGLLSEIFALLQNNQLFLLIGGISIISAFWGYVIFLQHQKTILLGKVSYILLLLCAFYAISSYRFIPFARNFMEKNPYSRHLQIVRTITLSISAIHFYFFDKK